MDDLTPQPSRSARRAAARRARHRVIVVAMISALGLVAAGGVGAAVMTADDPDGRLSSRRQAAVRTGGPSTTTTTTTLAPTTTTTTLPAVAQPPAATNLPPVTRSLGPGSDRAVVQAYEQRLADLRFDPGAIDGRYSGETTYAVEALQKVIGVSPTGRLGPAEAMTLAVFRYPEPLQPAGEPNRTELDVGKQVLTLYKDSQVLLITTTSTGSGERYCFNTPRINPTQRICEVATTPSGRFTYTRLVKGWDKSPLGQLYQPYYFNGGIAVHGYPSVPNGPASHGCARIPMHIAEYYPMLVRIGDPVYVFGGQPAEILSSTPI